MSIPLQDSIWLLRRLRPLSCTLAFSRPLRVKQFQSSPVPRGRVRATRSLPALRRVSRERTLTEVEAVRHTHRHHLVKCISRFHLLGFTTLQAQVPFVSIGRRGRPCLCFGSQMLVHYQRASHPEECRSSTHAAFPSHRSPDGPFRATRPPVKGRTPPYPIAAPKQKENGHPYAMNAHGVIG